MRLRRAALVVVGAPVLVGLLGLPVFLAIRSDLPDPVATHRGRSGPDGFTVDGAADAAALLTMLTDRVHC